jgi:DNA-binding NtrC family response regulator
LFADIALPGGMSGSVLADTARTLRPRLRVLLTSGYAVAEASRAGVLPKTQLLDKPYTIDDLARSIRHAIDFGAPAEPDVK